MKIVDYKTLLTLPAGTVFSYFGSEENIRDYSFNGLHIKDETCLNNLDFFEVDIVNAWPRNWENTDDFIAGVEAMIAGGSSDVLDFDAVSREGLFSRPQRYAVWGRRDVEALIQRLSKTLEEDSQSSAS